MENSTESAKHDWSLTMAQMMNKFRLKLKKVGKPTRYSCMT